MPLRLEDYALIGDTHSAALVGRDGSLDWLCLPRFDSGACFAALLGDDRHGTWALRPRGEVRAVGRRYRPDTLVLETELEAGGGVVRLVDFMPVRDDRPNVIRIVEGLRGRVPVRSRLAPRFDYGSVPPWFRPLDGGFLALAGPDALAIAAPGDSCITADGALETELVVGEGDRAAFAATWFPSHETLPEPLPALEALAGTERWWREWASRCADAGPWRDAVVRSLITLKAMTYEPTGGLVAAPTTSLPEQLGGVRNWDYRYCWVRDATFTLYAFLDAGYTEEAAAWRDWLLRAVAGDPDDFQLMYGPAGERRLPELELEWLPGYEDSRPVRIGNAAHRQRQLDVFGELMDALHKVRKAGIHPSADAWQLQRRLLDRLESGWREPDAGIWEMRGPGRDFTHSKVMAWVAFDRAAKAVEQFGLDGPVERWRRTAAEIHAEVCERGWNAELGAFVQHYGSGRLDAALLMLPLVGFLPASDERVRATVEAIERDLTVDGLVFRYAHDEGTRRLDALPPGEGCFLPCSFWLADCLVLLGRRDDARELFERLLALRNDVGLLAEEYDVEHGRLVGNFPQAFTHLSLTNAASNLTRGVGPAHDRGEHEERQTPATSSSL